MSAAKVTFPFAGDIQLKLLAAAIADPEKVRKTGADLRPELFDNPALRDFAAILYRFAQKYHRPPDLEEFEEQVEKLLQSDLRIPVDEYRVVLERLENAISEGHFEYAIEEAVAFTRVQAMRNALLRAAERLNKNKDLEKIILDVTAALSIGSEAEELAWRRMSEIEPEELEWLWDNRFALGKLSLIVGDPESGKSLFSAYMAAHVSSGTPWPDAPEQKPRPEPGKVIFLQDEDDPEDTLVRRVIQFGGARENIIHVDGIRSAEKGDRLFSLLTDLARLEKLITCEGNVKLIVLDPLSAYFGVGVGGKLNPHVDAHVRTILSPVKAFAKRLNVAVVGLVHLNKDAQKDMMYRVGGSIALMGVPRSVWLVKWDRDPKGPRYFQSMKSNLRTGVPGLAFYIDPELGDVRFDLNAEVPKAAELLAVAADRRPREEAKAFLLDRLKNGPRDARELRDEAVQEGINYVTLCSARKDLGVRAEKISYGRHGGKWTWYPPSRGEEAQPEPCITGTQPEPRLEEARPKPKIKKAQAEPSAKEPQLVLSFEGLQPEDVLKEKLDTIRRKRERERALLDRTRRADWSASRSSTDPEAVVEAEG
jgi:putative DNA primase/helicase